MNRFVSFQLVLGQTSHSDPWINPNERLRPRASRFLAPRAFGLNVVVVLGQKKKAPLFPIKRSPFFPTCVLLLVGSALVSVLSLSRGSLVSYLSYLFRAASCAVLSFDDLRVPYSLVGRLALVSYSFGVPKSYIRVNLVKSGQFWSNLVNFSQNKSNFVV
jgi:hypothetical protein